MASSCLRFDSRCPSTLMSIWLLIMLLFTCKHLYYYLCSQRRCVVVAINSSFVRTFTLLVMLLQPNCPLLPPTISCIVASRRCLGSGHSRCPSQHETRRLSLSLGAKPRIKHGIVCIFYAHSNVVNTLLIYTFVHLPT